MDHDRQLGEDAGVRAELLGEHAVDLFLRRDRSISRDRLDRLATPLVTERVMTSASRRRRNSTNTVATSARISSALHAARVAESPHGGHDQRYLPMPFEADERGTEPKLGSSRS
jgi:hypothetical protein